jgi:signal transduction histidine kinase
MGLGRLAPPCYKPQGMTTGGPASSDTATSSELELRSFTNDLRLSTVADIARGLTAQLSLEQLLHLIMDRLTRALDAERSTLFLPSDDGTELWSTVALGDAVREIRIRRGHGLAGWVAATGRGVNVKDAYADPRFDPRWDDELGFRTRSMLCQPVFDRDGRLVAVAQVLNKRHGWFTVEDETLLRSILAMAAIAIVNAHLHQELYVQNVHLHDAQVQLAERASEIDLLYDLERTAGAVSSLEDLLAGLVRRIGAAVPVSVVQIAVRSPNGWCVHRWRLGRVEIECLLTGEPAGLVADVVRTGEPATCVDACGVQQAEQLPFVPHAGLALPLQVDGELLGVLSVYEPAHGHAIADAERKLLTVVSGQVARAVAERQAREQAEREDRLAAVGRALAGVIHDLRTPMTVASGDLQLLKREDDATERARLANDALRQLDRIMQMTRELLAFARGEASLLVRKVLLDDFAHEAEDLCRQVLQGSQVALSVICRDRGAARFDAGKLLRVVQNLARNARDALIGRGGGRFDLDIGTDGEHVVVTCADNGPGVPMSFQPRMFDVFATHGKKDGTGLGLALAKQVAEAHGGTLSYRDGDGGGARFEIRIPREPPALLVAEAQG